MKRISPIVIFISLLSIISRADDIKINVKGCEYSIIPFENWYTIPQDTIEKRFGKDFCNAGLSSSEGDAIFKGDYVLYFFIPTIKSLNQFSLSEIEKMMQGDIAAMKDKPMSDGTVLQVLEFSKDESEKLFYLSGVSMKQSKKRGFSQLMIPTKFGFIKIVYNTSIEGGRAIAKKDLRQSITISDNFLYAEPVKKFRLNVWHILLSIGFSLGVYFSILYFSVIKQFFIRLKEK